MLQCSCACCGSGCEGHLLLPGTRRPLSELALEESPPLVMLAARPPTHLCLPLQGTFDNLVNGFDFRTKLLYEISTSYFSVGNVVANGKGQDLTLELMYGAAYGNLFTNIHLGNGTKPFGWVVRGQDASAYNTFWNIRTATQALSLPPSTWAPKATFVNALNAPAVGCGPLLACIACPYGHYAQMRKQDLQRASIELQIWCNEPLLRHPFTSLFSSRSPVDHARPHKHLLARSHCVPCPPPLSPPFLPPPPVLRARCLQPNGSDSKGWYVESRSDIFPYDLWTSMARARGRPLPTPAPKRYSGPGYGCYANGTKCCRQATPGCPTCPSDAWDPSILYGCTVSAGWQFHLAVCSTWTRDVGCVAAAACPNFKSMLPVRLCA